MRLLLGSASLLLLGLVDLSAAWTPCLPSRTVVRNTAGTTGARAAGFLVRGKYHRNNNHNGARAAAAAAAGTPSLMMSSSSGLNNNKDLLHEFDYLLHETVDPLSSSQSAVASRRVIKLGGADGRAIVLTSTSSATTTTAAPAATAEQRGEAQDDEGSVDYDPYDDVGYDQQQQLGKVQQYQEQKPTLESRFKQMDAQDIIVTLIIPAIVSFAGLRWGFNKVAARVEEKADLLLDSFANEMVFHDGNFDEMRMCHADYSRQLLWMGPKKGDAMIKRFLQAYSKKKTVSPQAIGTLSYVFTLFKLSEERAAQILVSLCRQMGTEKISSAGKILFFGSRILQSPEGKEGLTPIKEMIMSTYRDEAVAETLVESSQKAIGEAAYRTAVIAGGKNQKTLTMGWEVLGLDKETATRIFNDEAKEGFKTDRETMYGGQTRKYDKKGNLLDEKGKAADPEAVIGNDDDDDEGNASNVYECSECGFTLFIAKGREFKFYGDDFKCPECGAKKDKFKPANIEED